MNLVSSEFLVSGVSESLKIEKLSRRDQMPVGRKGGEGVMLYRVW